MTIATLKKRSEFQRVRGGGRWSGPAFLMEGKARPQPQSMGNAAPDAATPDRKGSVPHPVETPRFGFTITRKMGNAVNRNRMRRRIKGALGDIAHACADPHFDYVIVARPAALDRPFVDIRTDLEAAFRSIHAGTDRKGQKGSKTKPDRPK